MENLTNLKNIDGIPEAEQADMATSPVTQEEIDSALKALQEAPVEDIPAPLVTEKEMKEAVEALEDVPEVPKVSDEERIDQLRKELKAVPPSVDTPEEYGDDDKDPRPLGWITPTYSICEACKGKGRISFY